MMRSFQGTRPAPVTAWLPLLALANLACGSPASEPSPAPPPAEPTAPASGAPPQQAPQTQQAQQSSDVANATPASTPAPAAQQTATPLPASMAQLPTVSDACAAFGTSNACAACVCERCAAPLQACAETPGCLEILACVSTSGCSGRDCFCGDASLTECLRGEGNGPCREVTLAAPGGKDPSAEDPSAGPASEAALAIGACAEDDDQCAEACAVETE